MTTDRIAAQSADGQSAATTSSAAQSTAGTTAAHTSPGHVDSAHARAWAFLLLASVFEIVFALATNATHGFTQLVPSIITVLAAGGGIFTLSLALRTLDVGVGYTVWTGIGSVGTVIFGTLLFDEQITPMKLLCFVAIIGGVVGLRIVSRPES